MPRPQAKFPAYCLHKQAGRGYTTIGGRQIRFPGKHNSPESRAAYDALLARWLANNRRLPDEAARSTGYTVSEIIIAFWEFAQVRYASADGGRNGELENFRHALRPLRRFCGGTLATEFGPKALRQLRSIMLQPAETVDATNGERTVCEGWSRTYANRQVDRIRRMFKWAAAEEMIPAAVHDALVKLEAVREGEGARETPPVTPVPIDRVHTVLPHLPPPVAAMVKLQLLTAARGGELFRLRTCDLDMSGPVWKAKLVKHKTAHKGHKRTIRFGPQAQEVLRPWLRLDDACAFLFTPIAAHAWRNGRLARTTPITPSQKQRAEHAAARPRPLAPHYNKSSYCRAVARACEVAFSMPAQLLKRSGLDVTVIPGDTAEEAKAKRLLRAQRDKQAAEWRAQHIWSPHQLRHTAGTNYRQGGDFEAAKIVLGHRSDSMTHLYAEQDERKGDAIVERLG